MWATRAIATTTRHRVITAPMPHTSVASKVKVVATKPANHSICPSNERRSLFLVTTTRRTRKRRFGWDVSVGKTNKEKGSRNRASHSTLHPVLRYYATTSKDPYLPLRPAVNLGPFLTVQSPSNHLQQLRRHLAGSSFVPRLLEHPPGKRRRHGPKSYLPVTHLIIPSSTMTVVCRARNARVDGIVQTTRHARQP